MGRITSGVGLISGLDIQALVKQLIALESQPLNQVNQRLAQTKQQQQAYMSLTANLLAVKGSLEGLSKPDTFRARSVGSSNPDVLTATVADGAPVGSSSFTVRRLVSTHQFASRGFADRASTPVGAGSLTFEVGEGHVDPVTILDSLNGGAGVRRGIITITDRSGASAAVDLRAVTDMNDVVEAINSQSAIRVRAIVDGGDRLRIVDQSTGTGTLTVSDAVGGFTAADLGIAGAVAAGEIAGTDIVRLSDRTRLATLNDGNGVDYDRALASLQFTRGDGQLVDVSLAPILRFDQKLAELNDGQGVRLGEVRITNHAGQSQVFDLNGAVTLQDVADRINTNTIGLGVSLAGSKIVLTDTTNVKVGTLKVEDVSGNAAADLGILRETDAAAITGNAIHRVDTVGAVIRAVQYAAGNEDGALQVGYSADGNSLVVSGATQVEALNSSNALRDLGLDAAISGGTLTSRALVGGLNTVLLSSLNGGSGVGLGEVQFTLRDGSTRNVDFSGSRTLSDVVNLINGQAGLKAEVGPGGAGITIDDSTVGTGQFQATDVSGTTAADLRLAAATAGKINSGDLQKKYISEGTLLADLNLGKGVKYARFRITNGNGATGAVTLSAGQHKTVGDVIREVNRLNIGVTAKINAAGDGIEIVDVAGAGTTLKVTDETGSTAEDLGILGTAATPGASLVGTFAKTVSIDADDTLDEVMKKINDADVGVSASIINNGTGYEPYRLSIVSETTGQRGRVALHTAGTTLGFQTLSQARDAVLVFGDLNSPNSIVVNSDSNTVTDVVDGVTINLLGTSSNPVDVTVGQDMDSIATDLKAFVKTYNDTLDQIDELTKFDSETQTRGILLGDSTLLQIQSRMRTQITSRLTDSTLDLRSGVQVGFTFGSGARLQFDEEKFKEAYEADADAVIEFFTKTEPGENEGEVINIGFAAKLKEMVEGLTDEFDGVISRAENRLDDRVDLYGRRATQMQESLDAKEQRLLAQFQAMERALAGLQGQQSALSALAGLASSVGAQGLSLG